MNSLSETSLAPGNIKAPKRILMTADTLGGVWNYSIELARALQQYNTVVALATMGAPLSAIQRHEASSIPNLYIFESNFKLEWMDEPWQDVERAGSWLLDLEASVQPEVVHINGYSHAGLKWRAPTLVVAHSCVLSWWESVRQEPAPAQWDRYRAEVTAGLNAADAVLAPTQAMLSSLHRHYQWSGDGEVVPNGRDDSVFAPPRKKPFMLCAGRLWDAAKNLSLVQGAAPELPWPVYAAGDNTHPEGGKAHASAVNLLGQLAPEVLARWMAAAAIFIAPARYEPFGLAILEAGLSGCALILGNIESLRELWSGAALFVSPDEPGELVGAVKELVSNPDHLLRMGRRARIRALEFSRSRMRDGYLNVYTRMTGEHAPAQTEIAS